MGFLSNAKAEPKPLEIFRMEVIDKTILSSEYGDARFAILFVHEKDRAKTFTYSSYRHNNVPAVYANVKIGETYDVKFYKGDSTIIAVNALIVGKLE
jgi:hypothetical protein